MEDRRSFGEVRPTPHYCRKKHRKSGPPGGFLSAGVSSVHGMHDLCGVHPRCVCVWCVSEVCDLYMRYVAVWGTGQGCVKCVVGRGHVYNVCKLCGVSGVV